MKVAISISSTQQQSECAKLLFNTDKFLPHFRKLASMKGKGIDVDKIQQLLFFLGNASDSDIFDFLDSGKQEETLKHIEVIEGSATILEFIHALTSMYVPLVRSGMNVQESRDVMQEAEASLQPIKNMKPANVSAAKSVEGKQEHPNAVHDVGHIQIPVNKQTRS